jgi:ribonuclease HII
MQVLKTCFFSDKIEAGIDEAGRGALAGPVVAAAVILPVGFSHSLLQDSKKLSIADRLAARELIITIAESWSIGIQSVEIIDKINILNATYQAMYQAVDGLQITPDSLLIDGKHYRPHPTQRYDYQCIIDGDAQYQAIAAASILAKTFRDEIMLLLHDKFPQYFWNKNKGYGTPEHLAAINACGICTWHRKSFLPARAQLALF